MIPGADPMGAPTSFTARRPNASNLPNFELPPPPLASFHNPNSKFGFPLSQQSGTSLTSVGNLLTPPSNSSADGLSPLSTAATSSLNQGALQAFSPNGNMWQGTSNNYGFQTSTAPPFGRGLYSPSLNSMMMNNPMMQTPVSASSQASPIHSQDAFARTPHTPTFYNSQQSNHQNNFSYSTGPSSMQQSPISAGGSMSKMSPINGNGHIPSLHQQPYAQNRYSYGPGPVLSNVNNPNGHMSLVGGMQHGMMPGYNSGHAAHMGSMYGHQQSSPHTDRPFRCDQCPQSFNRNHDLKRHKRIHLAVKPFPCGHCDKSFSRKDALKRHVLVKGCGRAHGSDDKREDGSISPVSKSESVNTSPIVSASA